jgi:hypothetical protein
VYTVKIYVERNVLLNNTANLPRLHSVDGSTDGMILKGQPKYPEKTCPSVILPTTNSTWTGLGLNLGLQGKKQRNKLPEPWHGQNVFRMLYSSLLIAP